MTPTIEQPETIGVDKEYLRALEFEAYGEKSRGTLPRQREVREILNEYDTITEFWNVSLYD